MAAPCLTAATAAEAQTSSGSRTDLAQVNEIIVTARKRAESDLKVPIAISAMGKAQLDQYNITKIADVAAMTPSLNVSANFGSQGGGIALRGISTAPLNAASEQSVALNFDGVTVSHGAAIRFSQFDLERIEVLKGPQSLYFGKNTSAGIISVVSADPTKDFFAMARVGYEFNANELTTEGVISGPLSADKSLTARLAVYHSDLQGWLKNPVAYTNVTPPQSLTDIYGPLQAPKYSHLPNYSDIAGRLTLKYEPSDNLTIRLKGTYAHRAGAASNQSAQLSFCASGVPAPGNPGNVPGIGTCGLDNNWSAPVGQNPTAQQGGSPLFRDGQPYEKDDQYLLVGNLDWTVADGLTLSSTTGYYNLHLRDAANATFSPYPGIGSANDVKKTDFTQELRLQSDFSTPLNFMVGLYYNKGKFYQNIPVTILQTPISGSMYRIPNNVYSLFGNISYALFNDKLTLSAGGRYTREKKKVRVTNQTTGDIFTGLAKDAVTFKKFNPELNISWTPTNRITVYGTYKKGSKSGGFNADTLAGLFPGIDISYDDENVEGFEGGVKSVLAGGALRLDLAAFSYEYKNLQVGYIDPVTAAQVISNAATARLKGVEISMRYSPPGVRGLTISGALNYDHARYKNYLGLCYTGQTIADGCAYDGNGNIVTSGATQQNFSGRPLLRAPDWSGSLNATYNMPVAADDTSIGISVGGVYTGSFYPMSPEPPTSLQKSVFLVNSTVRLYNDDKGWELALIGKNLTDKRRMQLGVETPFTPGVASGTGTAGPGHLADLVGFTNRPREVMLRLTVKSNLFK